MVDFDAVFATEKLVNLIGPQKLATIRKDGQLLDVVAGVTKQGWVFVFDRVTGEPVWPIEERPVPQSDVPGEKLAVPVVTLPPSVLALLPVST